MLNCRRRTIEEGDEEAGEDGVPPQVAMDRAVATVRPEKAAPVQQETETSLRVTVEVRKAELELLHTTILPALEHACHLAGCQHPATTCIQYRSPLSASFLLFFRAFPT